MTDNLRSVGVRAVFVIGSPRSGTTMLGNYLGSARSVLNAGEYRALYLTYGALPVQLFGVLEGLVPAAWEPHRQRYLEEAQRHAVDFIRRTADQEGCAAFCDSTPRNAFVATQLAETFPDALFVLSLRHYSGTIQSLGRLGMMSVLPGNERSMDWRDPTAVAAGIYWSRHYEASLALPPDRTVAFGYDRFCADPEPVLARFKAALRAQRFPVEELDDATFAVSHASMRGRPRMTVGGSQRSRLRLRSIPSYDAATWTPAIEADVRPAVEVVDGMLASLYPDDYAEPAGFSRAMASSPGPPAGR